MTDEQIKQNAHDYTYTNDHNWTWDDSGESRVDISAEVTDAFIAGAHSRDEEIKQIRNPWISVEERLPEIGDIVVINVHNTIDGGGEHHEEDQILVGKYDGRWICDRCEQHRMGKYLFDTISKTTHWMPIPPIEKEARSAK